MSSQQGIPVRFTLPPGLHITDHLSKFTSARARNLEIMRLAENALLAQKGVTFGPPANTDEPDNKDKKEVPEEKTSEYADNNNEGIQSNALSSVDLTSIGND